MQGADFFLREISLTPGSYFDPATPAVVQLSHASRLNYEWYFFATTEEKARFDAEPLEHCGYLTDPVSKQRFEPLPDSPTHVYGETTFVFLDENTLARFQADPERYKVPMFGMS